VRPHTGNRAESIRYVAHDAVRGNGERPGEVHGSPKCFIDDDTAIDDEDNPTWRRALGAFAQRLTRECENRDVDDTGFTRSGGQCEDIGPPVSHDGLRQSLLPWKRRDTVDCLEKRAERIRLQRCHRVPRKVRLSGRHTPYPRNRPAPMRTGNAGFLLLSASFEYCAETLGMKTPATYR
jgi:hypothetical protein